MGGVWTRAKSENSEDAGFVRHNGLGAQARGVGLMRIVCVILVAGLAGAAEKRYVLPPVFGMAAMASVISEDQSD